MEEPIYRPDEEITGTTESVEEKVNSLIQELKERKVILDEAIQSLTKDEIKLKVYEILIIEGDEILGRRLYDFCEMVDWSVEALYPLLQRNPQFISDVENLTHLEFYTLRANVLYNKATLEKLTRIELLLTKEFVVPVNTISAEDEERWKNERTEAKILIKGKEIIKEDKEKTVKDDFFDSLLK